MTRRLVWLGIGAALGGGSTVWARRRLGRLSHHLRPGQLPGDVAAAVDLGARHAADHVRSAVDSGRAAARRRERELRHDPVRRDPGP
jgi:hypothetical protein